MKKINRKSLVVFMLFLILIVLEGINVYLSNTIAGSSIEASGVRIEISKVDEQITLLRSELYSYSSFDKIASRAAELGFADSKEAMVITAPLPVVLR